MKYLVILLASVALIACTNQKTNKSKEVMQADGDPSYVISKNINDNNRMITNTVSTLPKYLQSFSVCRFLNLRSTQFYHEIFDPSAIFDCFSCSNE